MRARSPTFASARNLSDGAKTILIHTLSGAVVALQAERNEWTRRSGGGTESQAREVRAHPIAIGRSLMYIQCICEPIWHRFSLKFDLSADCFQH